MHTGAGMGLTLECIQQLLRVIHIAIQLLHLDSQLGQYFGMSQTVILHLQPIYFAITAC